MVEKIYIKKFKSIKEAALKLSSLNVLIGANGSGKSNLISLFELVNAIQAGNLDNYVMAGGGCDRFLYNGRKYSEQLNCKMEYSDGKILNLELRPAIGDKLYVQNDADITKELKNNGNRFMVYHFHDTSVTSSMRSACNISDNEYLRSDASNLAACLYRLQHEHNRNFLLVEGIVKSVAPYFKCFKLREHPLNREMIILEWEQDGTDAYFDAYSFSDGTLRFIALATLLLQPTKGKTLIIDEPELGLHPSAVNKIAALLRMASKENQVLVATQSVNLINNFDPSDIVVTDFNAGTTYRRLDQADLASWIEDYSLGEIWEKNIIGGRP